MLKLNEKQGKVANFSISKLISNRASRIKLDCVVMYPRGQEYPRPTVNGLSARRLCCCHIVHRAVLWHCAAPTAIVWDALNTKLWFPLVYMEYQLYCHHNLPHKLHVQAAGSALCLLRNGAELGSTRVQLWLNVTTSGKQPPFRVMATK